MIYNIQNLLKQRQREKGYRLLIRNLRIPRGAMVALTGPSGCGKSTTLDILGLSLRPDSAEGMFFRPGDKEWDILHLWRGGGLEQLADLRLASIGYVLQSGELLPFLNLGENMLLTGRLAGMDKAHAVEAARELAEKLGIAHLWKSPPAAISVGERQRAAICRALVPHPPVILADEPTAALDPVHASRVMELFLSIARDSGSTLVLVTHNARWARDGGLLEIPFSLEEDGNGVTAVLDYHGDA